MFRPCFETTEKLKNAIPEEYFGDFQNKLYDYKNHIAMLEEAAKVYILENWDKIDDWSDLNVTITDGRNGKSTVFYKYKSRKVDHTKDDIMGRFIIDSENDLKEMHNPIHELSEVVLDPTDGDFSLTINGEKYWWIMNGIIEIADYIERKLKE